ncbi:3D-(3,5/4)-trihydroxycyclohexane-1,2-dione acylhydrolase (decyclizing) [Pleomorphomonas diazotrophica]|uniref:3D-(3,5/4)-trihydroxycyclohexane-1,2-dione acylhydrolase (Decyclizing) n=1 Tax=Pleomorphomonas diazotrophica TaxID=1166257 RepID=A0A1I4S6S5_9HYPH|nr:3D-(3,5/4)-trihydroxycyclohexane-1,2-dione acylhydrolase (decyclizing) [Pleomorphomonas diazotrophica]PKR89906.1 3D-(3,5/4)-trihydroxycyclohexane-1,2-dione acylhydrolase (decyclizing) [Pleomorphomonas diazotrophica]SFM60197.1 3D-(3,5/4)-trihydroxycyclohexane-1,2-dione hydrolase [Pleomorphomonas diazotrophica]
MAGKTVRLTVAQATVRFLVNQKTIIDGEKLPIFAGCWAIFGHGNVAGLGEALYQVRETFPTLRAHNEQAMALSAIAFAKASFRRRFMACTTSIGPGALNMVTAAAVAHVNRLPLLLLPGDVFANRRPDPVLQQVEDFQDGTVSANDCFRPVSRYFDRIQRPEQLILALQRTMHVLTDPAECGPVTLSMCQDVQAEAYDWPESLFEEKVWVPRRIRPDENELAAAIGLLKSAKNPMIIAGGGVLYSEATAELRAFAEKHHVPVAVTQAGKSSIDETHKLALGAVGVTGTSAANALAADADLVLAIGTRFQDFTTGSWALFKSGDLKIVALNVASYDTTKHNAAPLVADAKVGLGLLSQGLGTWKAPRVAERAIVEKKKWLEEADKALASTNVEKPSDAQVIGAVARTLGGPETVVVCAAGGLPGELDKLWVPTVPGSYHLEYGFSCMGYEIAGGIGVKMANPEKEVVVMVGDGSYMMMNSELATSVSLGQKLTVVLLDNHGFGCINRLQMATGGANFNNLWQDCAMQAQPDIDFRAHAESMGAIAVKASSISELETELAKARTADRSTVIVIDTDPLVTTDAGGHWWDVAVPETSPRKQVAGAREAYEAAKKLQRVFD